MPHPASPLALALLTAATALAAPLQVDINNSGRPLREGQDPARTPWSANAAWLPGGDTVSATFGDVTATFTRVGPTGTGLQTGYWKAGVTNATLDLKLTGDGLKVADGEAGAQLELRLSGLTPGRHSLLLQLDCWDAVKSPAPLDILVDGRLVHDDLRVTVQSTDPLAATFARLVFTVEAGRDVVVLLRAETEGEYSSRNVRINGFEIDTHDPRTLARRPVPAHGDEHVDADSGSLELSWTAPLHGAVAYDVYLGDDAEEVAVAPHVSRPYRGRHTATSLRVDGLDPHRTYYWRVDAIAADDSAADGPVWSFRPRRLAFPGAEGYGRFARGGRGGAVVKVTNLNDAGPGSLRAAIEADLGPRTIIFDVSGLITLQSDIVVDASRPAIMIAGQTAPGKGVCIRREQLALSGARDVVVRYVRGFVGDESGATQNATGLAGVDHCIVDHCSFGWGLDEGVSSRGAKNFTLQRTLLAEALNIAGHKNYPPGTRHGYAASVGGDIASLHHNLLAHNEGRNWSLAGGLDGEGRYAGRLDIFNNVVYNWRSRTTDGGAHQVNFVNNYYKPGPATTRFTVLNIQYGGFPGSQRYHMAGNVLPGRFDASDQEAGRTVGLERGGFLPERANPPYSPWSDTPFFPSHAVIHTATNAYKQVLSDVGANLPAPSAQDLRIIGETIAGVATHRGSVSASPGLPDTVADVGGWEDFGDEVRPAGFDSDDDGLPDWWEALHGTNPSSAAGDFSEANADPDEDGYTRLEDYLNWLASPGREVSAGSFVDIDLHDLARGYLATSPVFTLSGQAGGAVSLIAGRYARFTPAGSSSALGGFAFTVTDSAGDAMTRQVNLRILARSVVE